MPRKLRFVRRKNQFREITSANRNNGNNKENSTSSCEGKCEKSEVFNLSTATSWRSNNSRTCCILFIIIWDVHDVVGLLGCTGMFCLHITSVH